MTNENEPPTYQEATAGKNPFSVVWHFPAVRNSTDQHASRISTNITCSQLTWVKPTSETLRYTLASKQVNVFFFFTRSFLFHSLFIFSFKFCICMFYICIKYSVRLIDWWQPLGFVQMMLPTCYLPFVQATRTWRPSSPGTTRPSGRPSSGRYNSVTWNSWSQPDSSLSALLWYSVHPPAGVCHSHGSAAGHSGHCCTLLILVTTPLSFFFFVCLLPLWLKPDLNPVTVCLHSAPVRFFIQTHPGLYMAS